MGLLVDRMGFDEEEVNTSPRWNLAAMPDCQNVKALPKHDYGYRLRVGNYRVLSDWDGGIEIVEIQEARKRDERTY